MSGCVFCRILAKSIPASAVYEDEHAFAFMDIGQVNPGHVLVASKVHAENLFVLDERSAGGVFAAAARIARAIRAAFPADGLSVYQANGKAAGQTVMHFHIHLVPRHAGDGLQLVWPVQNPARATLEDYAERIKAKLA